MSILLGYTNMAYAKVESFNVGGSDISPADVVNNVVSLLERSIVSVATAMFLVGAFLYALSGEKEDRKNMGKDFMIGALVGVAIVVSAKLILNLTLYFIYG